MTPNRTRRDRLTALDRAALTLAIETARKHSPADRQQIDDKLACEPWLTAAAFAAHGCQETALRLQPWQCWPPCAVEPDSVDTPGLDHRGISSSAALLRRMLARGVSKFHPDPIAAIEAAEAESVRRAAVATAPRKEENATNADVDTGQDVDTPSDQSAVDEPPLALTDEQLDQIFRCAEPLHPAMRRLFVEHVAVRLRGKTLGDGEVFRACREVLRESGMWSPPLETEVGRHRTGVGKYAR